MKVDYQINNTKKKSLKSLITKKTFWEMGGNKTYKYNATDFLTHIFSSINFQQYTIYWVYIGKIKVMLITFAYDSLKRLQHLK